MTGQSKCILLDPPWLERGGGKRGAQNHYDLMSVADIHRTVMGAVIESEGRYFDAFDPAPDCHLWVWVTDNYLLDGLSLIDRLGFRYIRTIAWVKMAEFDDDGPSVSIDAARSALQIGLGQYARGSHELLLLATRGKAMVPPPDRRPPSVIFAPRAEHSRKPDESYDLIEQISPGPRVEFFARRDRPGWKHWGNEAPADETPNHGERDEPETM